MLTSMTGFASKTTTITPTGESPISITVNVKSLNSRFFESTFKLPYALFSLETDLTQLCKTKLKRGHLFFNITMSNQNLFKAGIEPADTVVQGYLNAIAKIKKAHQLTGDVDIAELIKLPNVFSMEEKGVDEETKKIIFSTTAQALDALVATRVQEGGVLQKDIEQRCAALTTAINEIEKLSEKVMRERKERVAKELQALGIANAETMENQRVLLHNELNKIDTHEEIVRFKSHLKNLIAFVASPEPEKGKRIDFMLQELTREINTTAAKCADISIGSLAITAKVELEKIREQIQNVV